MTRDTELQITMLSFFFFYALKGVYTLGRSNSIIAGLQDLGLFCHLGAGGLPGPLSLLRCREETRLKVPERLTRSPQLQSGGRATSVHRRVCALRTGRWVKRDFWPGGSQCYLNAFGATQTLNNGLR